jgi:hypothetical protein
MGDHPRARASLFTSRKYKIFLNIVDSDIPNVTRTDSQFETVHWNETCQDDRPIKVSAGENLESDENRN